VKQRIKILAIIFSVALNVAFFTGYGVRILKDRPQYAYEELDLSKDQRSRLDGSRDRFLRALNEIYDKMDSRHIELVDLIAADPVDRRAIDKKFEEIHSLQKSMQQQVVGHLTELKQIMTPSQQTRFFAVLKARILGQGAPGPPWLPGEARRRK
jgi:Spy/CpxP family protein refolding chaperone